MDQTTMLLALLPIFVIQIGLMIFALVDLIKNPNPNGPKWMWGIINIIGPIVYFVVGRRNY